MNNRLRLVHHQLTNDDQHYTLQQQQKVYTTSSTLSSSTSSLMQHHRMNASASAGANNSRRIDPSRTHAVNTRSVTFDKKQQQYLPKANNKTTLPIRRSGSYGNLSTKNIADKKICTCGTNNCKCKDDQNTDATLLSQYLRNLQQQIYFLEIENSHLRHHKDENIDSTGNFTEEIDNSASYQHNGGDYAVTQMMNDNNMPKVVYRVPDMFAKLETTKEANHITENHLHARLRELKQIDRERNQLSMQLKRTEDIHNHDKSALSNEIIDLQKRLDDLTPELAKKEAHIAELENELHRVNSKLRSAQNQLTGIQLKFDEKSNEDKVMNELENERRLEIERLTRTIRRLESDITENRSKNTAIMDELMATKRQMRENELRAKKEKALGEKVLEENNALIKENSQLSAQLARNEIIRERRIIESINNDDDDISDSHRLSDIAQLRETEKTLKAELQRANEHIKFEEKKYRQLELQIIERDTADEKAQESRLRMQKELEALQALSRSLSNENRTLRKDKIVLNDRIDEMNKLIGDKESEQQMLIERFDAIDKQYRRLVKRFEQDATLQTEKSHEYDLLSRRIRELSESLTRTKTSSHISPHRHEYRSGDSMASKLAMISTSGTSTPSSSLLSPDDEHTNKNKVNVEQQIVADDQQMVEKRKVYATSSSSTKDSHRRQADIDK